MTYRSKKLYSSTRHVAASRPRPPFPVRWGGRRNFSSRWIEPARVFEDLLPDLTRSTGDFGWACCPFHDDHNPSFSVNLRSGWYRCFSSSCGVTGNSIVSFVGAFLGLDAAEARRHVEARYG